MSQRLNNNTALRAPGPVPGSHCFFCGIGGAGMNPLAHLLARRGVLVSGADAAHQSTIDALRAAGITCHIGHDASHVDAADFFVYSSAIRTDNPEFQHARHRGIPCLHRAELLALMVNAADGVTIAGTHGKTTTTAMTAILFDAGGLDPIAVIGGFVPQFNAYFRDGHGGHMVVETDESDGSFERFVSSTAIVLNIDADHLDFYADLGAIEAAFGRFLANVRPDGMVIYNHDDPRVCHAIAQAPSTAVRISCALDSPADFMATDIVLQPWSSTFTVCERGMMYPVSLGVPGRHNVSNALHAIAAARYAGVSIDTIRTALPNFHGTHRRFQVLGDYHGATIIDDYAHHPRELAATMAAARGIGRPVLAVFQPHRFSRTEKLTDEFVAVLASFERLILTDIYAASELPASVSGESLYHRVKAVSPSVNYAPDLDTLEMTVAAQAQPGDVVLFLGAGTISSVAHALAGKGACTVTAGCPPPHATHA